MYKQIILGKLFDYLKLKKIPIKKCGTVTNVDCPFCKEKESVHIPFPIRDKGHCLKCSKEFNIIDIARIVESNLSDKTPEEDVLQYLKGILDVKVLTQKDQDNIKTILEKYQKWGFDLVPIMANGKIPIEKDWTNKSHKDVTEWYRWINDGLNIGVKTGKISGITILDVDQKPIPEDIKKIMGNPIIQESSKGYHLIYKYEIQLRKTRIDNHKIDIENDGGQVVIYPSMIKEVRRKWIEIADKLPIMPEELKQFLIIQTGESKQTLSEKVAEDIQTEEFNIGILGKGQRNSTLVRLGGIFRKELNVNQTGFVLNVLNKHLCDQPLPPKELTAMIGSLDRYAEFDEKELAHKVLEYLRDVEEANRTEIAMAMAGTNRGEEKKRIDKALTYLVKEEFIMKKGRSYSILKQADWKESLIEEGKPVDFKVPYFYDVATFNWGDMLLIGSRNKKGKTHISMNMVKQLVDQGIKPYYISLETGSRFAKIALQLGLKEGDFKWDFISDPTQIELEPNSVTIIDWLMIPDKSKTDLVFKHFIEQLDKSHGFLIVFMQLKEDNSWFAPNMVGQFPALSARYIYDNENSGEFGKFDIGIIREPKLRIKAYQIPCQYNWETKELRRRDEIEAEMPKEKENQNGES